MIKLHYKELQSKKGTIALTFGDKVIAAMLNEFNIFDERVLNTHLKQFNGAISINFIQTYKSDEFIMSCDLSFDDEDGYIKFILRYS